MTRKSILSVAFVMTLLISFIVYFPASYLLKQPLVQQTLPKGLALSQVGGYWWSGDATLYWQKKSLGKVRWQWEPSALLSGQVGVQLGWQQQQQTLAANVLLDVSGEQFALAHLNGHVKLVWLSQLDPAMSMMGDAQGDVVFKDFSVQLPKPVEGQKPWPTHLDGQVVLVDFEAMGFKAGLVEMQPLLEETRMVVNIQAKDTGWQLQGKTLLMLPNQFEHHYTLTAKDAASMPDWVSLMMRQTSPTQALLNGRGQW